MKSYVLIALLFCLATKLSAQRNMNDSIERVIAIGGYFGFNAPINDLAKRFGHGNNAGGSLFFKTKKNLTFEVNYGYFFGNLVKEDTILDNLRTEDNYILGREGQVVDVFLFQRGFNLNARIGRIINVIGPNPNCGLHAQLGIGIMQHKIRIESYSEIIPALENDYIKGYDRLTNGLSLMQAIGYQHFSSKKFINYYVGIEVFEGFTQNRRTLNFNSEKADNSQRLDIMGCIILKWYFPIYKRQAKDFYFY